LHRNVVWFTDACLILQVHVLFLLGLVIGWEEGLKMTYFVLIGALSLNRNNHAKVIKCYQQIML